MKREADFVPGDGEVWVTALILWDKSAITSPSRLRPGFGRR